jgi:hypothetical protein
VHQLHTGAAVPADAHELGADLGLHGLERELVFERLAAMKRGVRRRGAWFDDPTNHSRTEGAPERTRPMGSSMEAERLR